MGEIAQMMLDGTLCAGCGAALVDGEDDEPQGFPGYCCDECAAGADATPPLPIGTRTNRRVDLVRDASTYCFQCERQFGRAAAFRSHVLDKHNPNRKLRAKDRPKGRGAVACGLEGCDSTFRTEGGAADHRRMKHGARRENAPDTGER